MSDFKFTIFGFPLKSPSESGNLASHEQGLPFTTFFIRKTSLILKRNTLFFLCLMPSGSSSSCLRAYEKKKNTKTKLREHQIFKETHLKNVLSFLSSGFLCLLLILPDF